MAPGTGSVLYRDPSIHLCFNASIYQELFASALVFLKLEKVELGGSRGKILSEMVFSMNEEFHDSWRTLRESKHDPLDYTKEVKLVAPLFELLLMLYLTIVK